MLTFVHMSRGSKTNKFRSWVGHKIPYFKPFFLYTLLTFYSYTQVSYFTPYMVLCALIHIVECVWPEKRLSLKTFNCSESSETHRIPTESITKRFVGMRTESFPIERICSKVKSINNHLTPFVYFSCFHNVS